MPTVSIAHILTVRSVSIDSLLYWLSLGYLLMIPWYIMSHASCSFITILSLGSIPPVVQIMMTKVLDYMPDHAHLAERALRGLYFSCYTPILRVWPISICRPTVSIASSFSIGTSDYCVVQISENTSPSLIHISTRSMQIDDTDMVRNPQHGNVLF